MLKTGKVMEVISVLKQLGLTEKEAETYLALLKLGSVPAGPIIKQLGMHRAAVYNLLDILISKGLVHYVIQANRKYFEAQKPERLLEIVQTKKQEIEEQEKELMMIIPELESKRALSSESQEGTVYKGKKGVQSIFEDILSYPKSEYLVCGAGGKFKELFPAYFIHWHKRRILKKISVRIIYDENIRSQHREKDFKLAEIRYTKDSSKEPSTTFVYGDKVALIVWSDVPMAFLVRSEKVALSYRKFFDILWKNAQK
ncbi:MAG: helix-turn-helix domain-containing protein [Nanoarchaeota archaeon]|nr:helix-turn-helix domain-containing protein [Nanoarchaeota archaeon]